MQLEGRILENQINSGHVHRVDTDRITLNLRECGEGPLAIFLHGITSNSAVFEPLMQKLKARFRRVPLDLSERAVSGNRCDFLGR